MADCPHLRQPTEKALERLKDPLTWSCDSCSSTDGIWICLTCSHVGCSRRAHLPALGGGHARHHFHVMHGTADDCPDTDSCGHDQRQPRKAHKRNKSNEEPKQAGAEVFRVDANNKMSVCPPCGGHEVCIDIVTKALHCYICDDYVLSDETWLAELRRHLNDLEFHRSLIVDDMCSSPRDGDGDKSNDYELVDHPSPDAPSPLEKGTTGLTNLGNTCYMNATIQLLAHCSGFRSFFRDFLKSSAPLQLRGEGKKTIERQSTMLLKDLMNDQDPNELSLAYSTHSLLRVLWNGRWASISPSHFVNSVWTHSGLFAARRQQDANEFLSFFLGRLDDEMKPQCESNSVMMDLFGVNQYQEVTCDECQSVTKKTEPLLGLVLSLPDKFADSQGAGDESTTRVINLMDCFQSLNATGRFIGTDQFDCESCHAKKNATWKVALQKRPQSLLLSLRRTLWSREKGVHKDSRQVQFPLELDTSTLLGSDSRSPDADFDSASYKLIGLVSHFGSSAFIGHYVCYASCNDKWHLFNDARVSPATVESVLSAEAYILLYERQTLPSV